MMNTKLILVFGFTRFKIYNVVALIKNPKSKFYDIMIYFLFLPSYIYNLYNLA